MSGRADMVRRAGVADVSGCARVINHWIDETEWFTRVLPAETIESLIGEALPDREIWVVGDPIVGYISTNPDNNHIGALYCSITGAGLGKALLDQAKLGRNELTLNTHVPNTQAQNFYLREGFVKAGEIAPEPPETVVELRMEWTR